MSIAHDPKRIPSADSPRRGLDDMFKNTDEVSDPDVYKVILAVSYTLVDVYLAAKDNVPYTLPDVPEKSGNPEDDSWYDPVSNLSHVAETIDLPP